MRRFMLIIPALLAPQLLSASEHVSATNFYVVKQELIEAGDDVFWTEDNGGTFTVHEGPIESGFARCVGAGFGGPGGVTGGGVCVYGNGEDTFTMRWQVASPGFNTWHIVSSTGKYAGMTGQGTTHTRTNSKFLKMPHRISDWEGEIELPGGG